MTEKKRAKDVAKFQIKSIYSGETSGAKYGTGPVLGEIKVLDNKGEEYYLSHAYQDNCPIYFKTKESTFLRQVQVVDDKKFWDDLNDNYLIDGSSYWEVFEIDDKEIQDLMPLLLFLASIVSPEKYSLSDISDISITTKVVYYYDNEKEKIIRRSYEKLLQHNRDYHEERIKGIDEEIKYELKYIISSFDFDRDVTYDFYKYKFNKILELIKRKEAYIATNAKLTKQQPESKGKIHEKRNV